MQMQFKRSLKSARRRSQLSTTRSSYTEMHPLASDADQRVLT